MKFFLVESCSDDTEAYKKASQSLCRKLAEQTKHGAIISLNREEFEISKRMIEVILPESDGVLTQVEPGKSYLALIDQTVSIDDIEAAADFLQIHIGIVRTRTKGR